MFRKAHRCYTVPKGELEEVVTGFPHSSQLIKDKLKTRCGLTLVVVWKGIHPGQIQTELGPRIYSFTTPGCYIARIRCWQ